MKPIWIFAAFMAATPATAALSGFYDSAAQITAITSSAPVANALKQLPISGMKAVGKRAGDKIEWRVWTERCSIGVLLAPVAKPDAAPAMGRTDYQVSDIGRCR